MITEENQDRKAYDDRTGSFEGLKLPVNLDAPTTPRQYLVHMISGLKTIYTLLKRHAVVLIDEIKIDLSHFLNLIRICRKGIHLIADTNKIVI